MTVRGARRAISGKLQGWEVDNTSNDVAKQDRRVRRCTSDTLERVDAIGAAVTRALN